MKKAAKSVVAAILGWQVRRLYKKNNFKVIAVTGSIGKTSTKLAIAKVLSQSFKVQFQEGNYNDIVSVPLVFFGQELPSLFNPYAWLRVFLKNEAVLRQAYPFNVVVVEVGTDAPGQVAEFRRYIHVDIAVIAAVTPEHMEFFADLNAVAVEELSISKYSDKILVNSDLTAQNYYAGLPNKITYAIKNDADYQIKDLSFNGDEASFSVFKSNKLLFEAKHEHILEPLLYSVCAAVAVGIELGMQPKAIEQGISVLRPASGRMNRLAGINNSVIIDDTYNASPEAVKAALDTLYRLNAKQKIAILGNMNELGSYSEQAHKDIGSYCDPKRLNMVVTIGPDANQHLALMAKANGCDVISFTNPYDAGKYLKDKIKPGALILAKGSQNGVFAEETVKMLLANPADAKELVRQSANWLKRKNELLSK